MGVRRRGRWTRPRACRAEATPLTRAAAGQAILARFRRSARDGSRCAKGAPAVAARHFERAARTSRSVDAEAKLPALTEAGRAHLAAGQPAAALAATRRAADQHRAMRFAVARLGQAGEAVVATQPGAARQRPERGSAQGARAGLGPAARAHRQPERRRAAPQLSQQARRRTARSCSRGSRMRASASCRAGSARRISPAR